jgi:hypothetical protein
MLILFAIQGCVSTGDKVKEKGSEKPTKEITSQELEYLLPSPGEILDMVHDLGLSYDIKLLSPIKDPNGFVLFRNQALNFGVYLTDFSYLLLFEKYSESFNYLSQIQEMALLIGVEKYFDEDFFNSILSNLNQPDTLKSLAIDQTTLFYNRMESIGNKDLVLLITTGAMIEVIFLASNLFQEGHINDNTLTTVLNFDVLFDVFYLHFLTSKPDDPSLIKLSNDLQLMRKIFKSMNIKHTSTAVNENGKIIISTDINHEITNKKVGELKALTSIIRNKLINQKY